MEGKTLLQKIDLITLLFVFFIVGILIYDIIPLVIPLRYPILQGKLLLIVGVAFICYLLGKKVASRRPPKPSAPYIPYRSNISALKILIVLFFVYGLTYYLINGIPLLVGDEASALKGQLVVNADYGVTRVIYTILPFLATLLLSLYFSMNNRKYFGLAIYLLLPFTLLFIGLFKGAILTYLVGLLFIFDKYKIRLKLSFKTISIAILLVLIVTLPIYYTEIADFGMASLYMLNRLIIYSWEGFNYIVLYDLPPNYVEQFQAMIGTASVDLPGHILAAEMTGVYPPPLAINTTLFGFAYQNGGMTLVVVIFFLLGFCVKKVIDKFSTTRNNLTAVTCLFVYIALMKMFLVGEPFIDIRGVFLTIFIIHYFVKLVFRLRFFR